MTSLRETTDGTMTKPGGVGVLGPQLRWAEPGETREAAAELQALGYSTLWVGDFQPGPIFADLERLLGATSTITVATGVLNLWMHELADIVDGFHATVAAHPGRFLMGVGISHAPLVEAQRPGEYRTPLRAMGRFLDQLATGDRPVPREGLALAALGPKMVALSRDRAGGAKTYLVTPDHTADTRKLLGSEPLLAVGQVVALTRDPGTARAEGRRHLANYLAFPNYANNFLRMGFTEADLADGGSDRLIDSIVAWGDEDTIARRVQEHLDAGADHVAVIVATDDYTRMTREQWRALAPALVDVR